MKLLIFAFIFSLSSEKKGDILKTGEKLFKKGTCSSCHNLTDKKKIGPGLLGLFERLEKNKKDEKWLKEFLKNPSKMIEKDEYAKNLFKKYKMKMPKTRLEDEEIDILIQYLKEATKIENEESEE